MGWQRGRRWGGVAAVLAALVGTFQGLVSAQSDPTVYVVNRSSLVINNIYVSAANSETWGRDWLGDKVLSPGERIRVAPPRGGECVFDVRVVYANDQEEERRRLNLCSMDEVVFNGPGSSNGRGNAAPANNADFEVVNRTSRTIMEIYVSPQTSDNWGDDKLPSTLAPGAKFMVRLPRGECTYDVRVVYDDRSTEDKREQDLCAISEMVFNGSASERPSGRGTPAPSGRGTPAPSTGLSFGTGFFVSGQGYALTNNHVAGDCGSIAALIDGRAVPAQLVRRDPQNDLALLRVDVGATPVAYARFRAAPGIRPGESIVVAGYPLPSVLQNGLNVTVGNVSALAGLGGNAALMQITAPVQPGNSGGPLFDMDGNIVGVIVSKLNAMQIAQVTGGDIPQNINFAIQGAVARLFVEAGGQRIEERSTRLNLPVGDVVDKAREFTFQVECRPR